MATDVPPSRSIEESIVGGLESIGRRFAAMTMSRIVLIIGIIAVLRAGVAGVGPAWLEPLGESARAFPRSTNWLSSSVLPNVIARMTGEPGRAMWWSMGAVVLCAVLIGVWRMIRDLGAWTRPALILVCVSPAFATSLGMIGHSDIFMIAASLIVV